MFALTRAGFSSHSFKVIVAHYHACVANNRSVGCLVANFFVKIFIVSLRLPTRSNPSSTKQKAYTLMGIGFLWRRSINLIRTLLKLINYNKVFSINAYLRNISTRSSFGKNNFPMVIYRISAVYTAPVTLMNAMPCVFIILNYKFNYV